MLYALTQPIKTDYLMIHTDIIEKMKNTLTGCLVTGR